MGVVWCCGSCLLATCFGIHSLHFARDGAQRCCAPTGACVVATAHSQIGCATFSAKKREKSRGFSAPKFFGAGAISASWNDFYLGLGYQSGGKTAALQKNRGGG